MTVYDQHYLTEDLFGDAYPELVAFFEQYEPKGHVLDLGCGQGRDAIALARIGYRVTGVDVSEVGVEQMIEKASQDGLDITGIVRDLHEFEITDHYGIVLLDSMIHFTKKDRKREETLLSKISDQLKVGGLVCVCMRVSANNKGQLQRVFHGMAIDWEILNDTALEYIYVEESSGHRSSMTYNMLILKKVS